MNNPRESSGQNRPVRLDTNATVETQVRDVYRSVDQLWQEVSNLRQIVETLIETVNMKVTAVQVATIIDKKNASSSR